MNAEDYDQMSAKLLDYAESVTKSKRPAYTVGSDDVLANFKRVSERTGISPQQVALVYFLKHVDSIQTIVTRRGIIDPEPVKGRFADAINYLILLYALVEEDQLRQEVASIGESK